MQAAQPNVGASVFDVQCHQVDVHEATSGSAGTLCWRSACNVSLELADIASAEVCRDITQLLRKRVAGIKESSPTPVDQRPFGTANISAITKHSCRNAELPTVITATQLERVRVPSIDRVSDAATGQH
tara:strand:- start:172 stop:555 length:384 start_codon:yes stop_codon:yes gene_type:complete